MSNNQLNNNFIKLCPTCGIEMVYKSKRLLTQSIKRNSNCYDCFKNKVSQKFIGKPKSEEHKLKLSKAKDKHIEKYRQIMKELNYKKIGKPLSDEHKHKLSLTKMGDKNPAKRIEVRNKIRETTIRNYYELKPHSTFSKNCVCKLYNNTKVFYQGSYELDFLNKFYDKLTIINGKRFKYIDSKGEERIYISDFYLPDYNLILDIKSTYTLYKCKGAVNNEFKKNSVISNGFNFLFIVNKDYSEFLNLLSLTFM